MGIYEYPGKEYKESLLPNKILPKNAIIIKEYLLYISSISIKYIREAKHEIINDKIKINFL